MCEGSLHVAHRLATDKERLALGKVPGTYYVGLYPIKQTRRTDNRLVCVRKRTTAIIKEVKLQRGLAPAFAKYEGKRNLVVTLVRRHGADNVEFANGETLHWSGFKPGTRVDIGIPVRKRTAKSKVAGMLAIEGALREVMATEPKPGEPEKPAHTPPGQDPEREKPGNPTPGQKPEEHPGQGEPTPHPRPQPAARRRRKVTA